MKAIPALSFAAALVAFVLLPISFALGGTLLFGAAVIAIAISDYTRQRVSPYTLEPIAFRRERFGLAA